MTDKMADKIIDQLNVNPKAEHGDAWEGDRPEPKAPFTLLSGEALALTQLPVPGDPPAPYQPFPLQALPDPLGAYVAQSAQALGCDAAYVALPVLAAVASAIGNTRVVELKRGWTEPSVVWSLVVAESGTLKTPAYHKAVDHLFYLQGVPQQRFQQEEARYQVERDEYQDRQRQRRKQGGEPGPPPEPLCESCLVCSDITIERLAEILQDNPRGVLLARDELAAWFGSFTRYRGPGGGSGDLPNWLEMVRAGQVVVHRRTGNRRTLFVPAAAVSVTGGIQPGVLSRALTAEFLDSGLAARLLLAMPPKRPKRWSEAEVHLEIEAAYHGVLDRLLTLDFEDALERRPRVLALASDAHAAWVVFYDAWAQQQAEAEGEVAAALSKLEAYAARLALAHHVVGRVALGEEAAGPIGRASVQAGMTLCQWFAAEARRVYAVLAESSGQRDRRRLVEFIQGRGGRITERELQRSNNRRFPSAALAEAKLEELVQAGLGSWVQVRPAERGKHPGGYSTRAFELGTLHDA